MGTRTAGGTWLLASLLLATVWMGSFAVRESLDLDGDGLVTSQERAHGTDPALADTDGDGLSDGWEALRQLNPLDPDSDADSLDDGREVRIGSNPFSPDSDGDGLPDAIEDPAALAVADCDADGVPSILEQDDDNDSRIDALEPEAERCRADTDGDGVLDGWEGNAVCTTRPDCDSDGLGDAEELRIGYDPLDPDSFDAHFPDAVSYAFQQQGQSPGADADGDGIPDPWESESGLIAWGPFAPRPGQADLLIEYVRVVGPDSGRFTDLDLGPAYEAVASAFAGRNMTIQHVETVIPWPTEPLPALLPTRTADYYRAVLDNASHAANPYVLTVVMNPQLNQSDILHSGIAPLRGLLAAIDLGQTVEFSLRNATGALRTTLTPFMEAVIRTNPSAAAQLGPGTLPDGRYYRTLLDSLGRQHRLEWTPFWIKDPIVQLSTGERQTLFIEQVRVVTQELAGLLMHEIGHSLGLCHTHEPECAALLPVDEQGLQASSSMSYDASPDTVAYLPGEWIRVRSYLVCPPPDPVRLVALSAPLDEVLDAKYAYGLGVSDPSSARTCQDFGSVPRTLEPVPDAHVHRAPDDLAAPAPVLNDATSTNRYFQATFALGLAAGVVPVAVGRAWRREV